MQTRLEQLERERESRVTLSKCINDFCVHTYMFASKICTFLDFYENLIRKTIHCMYVGLSYFFICYIHTLFICFLLVSLTKTDRQTINIFSYSTCYSVFEKFNFLNRD